MSEFQQLSELTAADERRRVARWSEGSESDPLQQRLLRQETSESDASHSNIHVHVRPGQLHPSPRNLVPSASNERSYTWAKSSWFGRLREFLKQHWHSLRTPKEEEGLDFEHVEDEVNLQRIDDMLRSRCAANLQTTCMWVTGALIAILVSSVSVLIDVSIERLTLLKMDHVQDLLQNPSEALKLSAFAVFSGLNILFVAVAATLVAFLDIRAKGSGVPEIKSFLNGRKIHRVISIRTLVTKVAGVILSVSGAMIVGKEGPMIHAGAVIGAIVSQGRAELSSFGISMLAFRNDDNKRKFVSIGCACGIAAAFSAPIGAVLFVIEEAASYWSVTLTWVTFFASILCCALVDVVLSGIKDSAEWGVMSQSAVVSFGAFEGASRDPCYLLQPSYSIRQVPGFVLFGVLGGTAGVLFNKFNLWITELRAKYITSPNKRVLEALVVSLLTSVILFGSAYAFPCRLASSAKHVNSSNELHTLLHSYQSRQGEGTLRSLPDKDCSEMQPLNSFCKDSSYFSDMETLSMNQNDKSVRLLFHSDLFFDEWALAWYGVALYFLACVTYGTNIPSGLFVPAIMIGAAFGRIAGQLLYQNGLGAVDPGTYALLGAAAILGGITRMTISIVVILVETTNNVTYAVPIMITIMTAKIFGDMFNAGLYDIHVEFQGIKFLKDDPSIDDHRVSVRSRMTSNPVIFLAQESVGEIVNKLRSCTHNGFPVVHYEEGISRVFRPTEVAPKQTEQRQSYLRDSQNASRIMRTMRSTRNDKLIFQGTILRRQLCILLWEAVENPQEDRLHWRKFYKHYPRSPTILDVESKLKPEDYEKLVDLTPCVNTGALTVHHSVHMSRVHTLFRALGLRHLTVVDSSNQVLGILTRHDIVNTD